MDFMRFKWLYFLISALVILPGIYSLGFYGLKLSVDFTGGTLFELNFDQSELGSTQVKEIVESVGVGVASIQLTEQGTFLLRMDSLNEEQLGSVRQALAERLANLEFLREETVGPTLGQELLRKTIVAVILASSFIVFYVAQRFKSLKYGVCAILAMFHDTVVLLGSFSLLGQFVGVEIDTLFVTALLTILSFSVHDTVVVYDRIRESAKTTPRLSFEAVVNKAVAETLVRSLNNSLTIIFMLLALALLGGETIRWFVIALLIGTISGTYSSTFVAAPLLVVWEDIKQSKLKKSRSA
jgi:preprotein translocase subunit SecF